MDARLMTWQKWNAPRKKDFQSILSEEKPNGMQLFVSFQDVDFVEICPVAVCRGEIVISNKIEKVHKNAAKRGTHLCQTLLLMGLDKNFWKPAPEVLYITLLKFNGNQDNSFSHVREKIQEIMQEQNIAQRNWTLYYSLDFCDAVLFVKDISLEKIHSALWRIVFLTKKDNSREIRTSATILTFSRRAVMSAYAGRRGRKEPFEFFAEVAIEDQESEYYSEIKDELSKLQITVLQGPHRLLGRKDLRFIVSLKGYSQLINLALAIERSSTAKITSIQDYEIKPFITGEDISSLESAPDVSYSDELAEKVRSFLIESDQRLKKRRVDTVRGMSQSVQTLLDHGFSDELGLCLVEPLIGYKTILNTCKKPSEVAGFNRLFSTASLVSALSTMHGDQEFIQAPSLQIPSFFIPPKLLALYTAIGHNVVALLKNSEESYSSNNQRFWFMINPDHTDEIHVDRVSVGAEIDHSLSVIYMGENSIYNPTVVVPAICHEIAHQVGNRKRRLRAKLLMSAIAGYLVRQIISANENTKQVVFALADALGGLFYSEFSLWHTEGGKTDEYYLHDIKVFLEKTSYFTTFFQEPHQMFLGALRNKWSETLSTLDHNLVDSCCDPLKVDYPYLKCLPYEAVVQFAVGAWIQLLKNIINQWITIDDTERTDKTKRKEELPLRSSLYYQGFCDGLVSAFSEAFCDLMMVTMTGINTSNEYYNLLKKMKCDDTLSMQWRKTAVTAILDEKICDIDWNVDSSHVSFYLHNYLQECQLSEDAVSVRETKDLINKQSVEEVIFTINSILSEYRRSIVQEIILLEGSDAVANTSQKDIKKERHRKI